MFFFPVLVGARVVEMAGVGWAMQATYVCLVYGFFSKVRAGYLSICFGLGALRGEGFTTVDQDAGDRAIEHFSRARTRAARATGWDAA